MKKNKPYFIYFGTTIQELKYSEDMKVLPFQLNKMTQKPSQILIFH